jgi:polysaccharide biosynthesis protein PslG
MKKLLTAALIIAALLVLTPVATPLGAAEPDSSRHSAGKSRPVEPWLFAMTTHWFEPWPMINFAGLRLWSTHTTWAELNPSQGVYDWTILDKWLAAAQKSGSHGIILTLAMTPRWASSNPDDQRCHQGPGQCDAPNDLNSDGTGTDQHWKDFITAVATHANGQIRFWELWNEPVNYYYWSGTFPQMVRMAKDAHDIIHSINPHALMLSPPNGADLPYGQHWWEKYAAAGGLNYADVIAFHGYSFPPPYTCGIYPQAAALIGHVGSLRKTLAQ